MIHIEIPEIKRINEAAKTTKIKYSIGFINNSSYHDFTSFDVAEITSWLLGIIGVNTLTCSDLSTLEYATLKDSK